jgi:hypothetical protein
MLQQRQNTSFFLSELSAKSVDIPEEFAARIYLADPKNERPKLLRETWAGSLP